MEELAEADLLVHVVDITHKNAAEQYQTVEDILIELELDTKPRLTVLNKIDLLGSDGLVKEDLEQRLQLNLQGMIPVKLEGMIPVSASQGTGLDGLLQRISEILIMSKD